MLCYSDPKSFVKNRCEKNPISLRNRIFKIHKSFRIAIDDLAARRYAKALKIPILGTGGLFILAKQRGIISSVTEALLSLRAVGLWLSDDLFELLIIKAGESK